VVTAPPSGRQTVPNVTKYNYFDTGPVQRSDHRVARAAKSYEYTPDGMRLSQTTHNSDGSTSNGYYTYNDHADVEVVTGSGGNTKSTYQYTAYGQDDKTQFTGADKNPPQNGTEPFNPYRYNAMRWDSSAAQYDMGFRDYDPGLNQFLSRDMYNGALDDMDLDTDPFTGNRYTFGGGNPVTNIELDGHMFPGGAQCGILASNPCNPSPATSSVSTGSSSTGSSSSGGAGCGFLGLGCAGHFLKNVGVGALNGITSIFTAPAANVVSGVYQAGGGIAQATYHLPGANPAAGLAARVNQIGSNPVPGGNRGSLSYKVPYYAAPLLLGGAGAIGKLRALSATEDAGELVGRYADMPSPRPAGMEAHHGINSIWARANVPGYSGGDAPAVLMEADPAHNATRAVFNGWRAETAARQGVGVSGIDWSAVSPGGIWRLAEEQFQAAGTSPGAVERYFSQWNDYLAKLGWWSQ
jgi:RHS repeat-associated protein